jgi:hypothetical protein
MMVTLPLELDVLFPLWKRMLPPVNELESPASTTTLPPMLDSKPRPFPAKRYNEPPVCSLA